MAFSNLNSSRRNSNIGATKCATVTMMLAERMAHSNWSVDDEHFFETNTMNVWQTLEFLSDITLRKRYHYEGYNDTKNAIRTLTPSWRRDSFAEKNVSQSDDGGKYNAAERDGDGGDDGENGTTNGQDGRRRGGYNEDARIGSGQGKKAYKNVKRKKRTKGKQFVSPVEPDPEYAMSPLDFTDLVKCSFNFPRISARLERLMGTNVVRLTDRKYMKDLRDRIEEDYRVQLQKRIRARELKEVERERILIIIGKSDIIPPELANDPIFMVNKKANIEIQKERAKLKTNRERNAERLKLQGVKWERERLQHEEEERVRLEIQRERWREQKELEARYKLEDGERGMDLLRIHDEDWRPCEQKLKEFLENERAKMKERSLRVPTPYSSDPKDIQNIVRARLKFRQAELRIRRELDEKTKESTKKAAGDSKTESGKLPKVGQKASILSGSFGPKSITQSRDYFVENAEEERLRLKYLDETSDVSSEVEVTEEGSSISESRRTHTAKLEEEMEVDVHKGLLISKEQYKHLRYEDNKILQLRHAENIRELYRLAEEIIIGERIIEEVIEDDIDEEQEEEEEEQPESEENEE